MKGIKEKAEEYRRVLKVVNEHESLVNTQGSEMFEAGANYVLEQLEEFLNLYGVYCMSSSARGYLKFMVGQLKSNQ